jgi:decaprenylphospho-beta-D-ribofuranose 2-oxidase
MGRLASLSQGLMMTNLTGWSRQLWRRSEVTRRESLELGSAGAVLSRGLGRAYGDAALPPVGGGPVLETTLANRFLAFDEASGLLRVEAGVSLRELTRLFAPRGWFSPVVPGTCNVTIGGVIAADIHGKNHHVAGSFGRHVRSMRVRAGDQRIYECSRSEHADLFFATLGGMGLTGHIVEATIALERVAGPWIYEESERFDRLEDVVDALRRASAAWPMTVAWIDTSATGEALGRGIVIRGRWASADEFELSSPVPTHLRLPVPFTFPNGVTNSFTFGVLNRMWFAKHGPELRRRFVDPQTFFWPLDAVEEWNRVFGPRGFFQYQCLLPSDASVFRRLLEIFAAQGASSFVSVLKDAGQEGEGPLSFLRPGTTLALDIPVDKTRATEMTRAFNEHVLRHGGRIYLAKDSFTTVQEFTEMYPRLPEFQAVRRKYDPARRIRSALSERLLGD